MTEADGSPQLDALIVGAGLSGLYQLKTLRDLGFTVRVVEAAKGLGGTWYWNRYPGARCDVESLSYSYSFSPELEQEWTWTEKYPTQPEILRYIQHVADRFDLLRDISLSTRVTSAVYDEKARRWTVTTGGGDVIGTRFLIMATGCLSVSKAPEIPGAERFQGPTYHTGHWPHEGVDFTGQRLGVIGTGSSGIQSIPIFARQASEMTVFQRTPNFSMPAGNRPLAAQEISDMKENYRDWRGAQRASGFGVPVDKIRAKVADPEVAEALCPTSFPFGTKRPCLDTGYYETFNAEHVHLVDLRKTPLQEITESGIRTSESTYEVDAIVFATGFDAMTGALTAVDIRGKGGVALKEKWGEGPRSYLGLAVAGFPNLFTITGPSSPSVLSNMIVSIEQHVEWVTDCIRYMRDNGRTEIDATTGAEDDWVSHVEEVGNYTLYPTADSWYMGSNVPGKPRVFMAYIGGVGPYADRITEIARNGYEGFALKT
ncbi:MAG: NAD(P)/FAD-dependent oxidoreductase [Pseudonocardia sp.]|nr:NAD(P)/FAD-dependent oxidoreductase [Pseudonocardia sp.]